MGSNEPESIVYIFITLVIMVVAGILGSYCRVILDKGQAEFSEKPKFEQEKSIESKKFSDVVVPGIVASFIVPLFLSVEGNSIMKNVTTDTDYAQNAFILFAFCLLAAVFSRNFINAVAQQAFKKANEADKKANAAEKNAAEVKDLISEEKSSPSKPDSKSYLDDHIAQHAKTDHEQIVLRALLDTEWTRRSLTGISNETSLDKAIVRNALISLEKRGVVISSQSKRTGNLLYEARLRPDGEKPSEEK